MPSKLRQVREREGLSRAELAQLSDLSERTIQRGENGANITNLTKNRILNALNRRPERLREYEFDDLFG
jgi:transcriptional regulator with XRE-family HTH domain